MADAEKQSPPTADPAMPGQIIAPGQTSQPLSESTAPASQPPASPSPEAVTQNSPSPYTESEIPAGPEYSQDSVSWTASEFISHEKDAGWYAKLVAASLVISILVYLLTRDVVSTGVILFVCATLGVYANRQPRQLPYSVSSAGVDIGDKHYGYDEFRSFAVMSEGAFSSIALLPLKRFAPLTTIYFAPDDEEKIIAILSQALPYEERSHDMIDRLMQRIRF